jgi:Ras family protein A
MSKEPIALRIVVVGDGGVGKTCMLFVFKGDPYPSGYVPTIFESHDELRQYEGKQYCLHLRDTRGQEEYDRLRPLSYAKCHCVLICFALEWRGYLKNVVTRWFAEVKQYCPKAAVVLVGTKSDLWNKAEPDAITQADIDSTAAQIKADKAIQCSAKKNENIGDVFDLAIAAVLQKASGKCTVA